MLEIPSHIRGYHTYVSMWTPVVGQTMLVKREPTNSRTKMQSLCTWKMSLLDMSITHHNIAARFSQFLLQDVNKAFADRKSNMEQVTG